MSKIEHPFDTSSIIIHPPLDPWVLKAILIAPIFIILAAFLLYIYPVGNSAAFIFLLVILVILWLSISIASLSYSSFTIQVNRKKGKLYLIRERLIGSQKKRTIPLLDVKRIYIRRTNKFINERNMAKQPQPYYLVLALNDYETIQLGGRSYTYDEAEHMAAQLNSILGLKPLIEQGENDRGP